MPIGNIFAKNRSNGPIHGPMDWWTRGPVDPFSRGPVEPCRGSLLFTAVDRFDPSSRASSKVFCR
eukprot:6352733-Amphidinium_carterae.2